MTSSTPSYLEDRISQIPALRLLMAMGWQYLPPHEVDALRGHKPVNVILDQVLLGWLEEHNHIPYKGRTLPFSEANLNLVVRTLKGIALNRGLLPVSADVSNLLTLPQSVEQNIDGDKRSFDVHVIDWENPANNVYHVTDEFVVERRGSSQTRRPDIVLFVNGIPLAVIECKRPDLQTSEGEKAVYEGVSQMLRNQRLTDEIPHLFAYTQLLLAVSVNDALYGATEAKKKYWATWVEEGEDEAEIARLANAPLPDAEKDRLFGWRDYAAPLRRYFDSQDAAGDRLPTAQDRTLVALLRPSRLLELVYQFIVYDNGEKKIARYQQYFAVKATADKVTHIDPANGRRAGGVIWHTTGSGKSLTMVMLAKALALHKTVKNPRVVIVTDRVDLDEQIWTTFNACGKTVVRADSGADLITLIRNPKNEIITTVIDKFEAAARAKLTDPNPNVFILVDESHRSQYGSSHARMLEVFPHGCYIGFTGTPLLKQEKSTADRFGGFIHKYTMRQAVADGAVVPLLYEGRIVDLDVNGDALDLWFERRTVSLNEAQKTDLKRKMSRFEEVNRARARLETIAWDIANHFQTNWRGTGFKGQLATASKEVGLQYLYALEDEGIKCALVISPPDTREGSEDTDETNLKPVQDFWKRMMQRYDNSEAKYLTGIKGDFKRPEGVEILIVVDKLLVGFDEPRNTVLYIDKPLKEHGLLQAIARVNRLHPGKDYGYIIDYRGVLGELDEALKTYNALEAFDTEDIAGTVTDVSAVLEELPSLHDRVWSVFDPVANQGDHEALERFLEPEDRRQQFYDALNELARGMKVALSTDVFYQTTPEAQIQTYKRDLLFFHQLRTSVKLRYAETVDYGDYEQKIRKLLNEHLKAGQVHVMTPEVNIFDETAFEAAVGHMTSPAARADAIAYRLKKTATEKMDEDPAFYRKFSQLVEDTIEQYRNQRISELEYLNRMETAAEEIRSGKDSSLPPQLADTRDAAAYFGLLLEPITRCAADGTPDLPSQVADLAIVLEATIERVKVRDWAHNPDVMNRMKNELEDDLYAFQRAQDISLSAGDLDTLMEQLVETARRRDLG